MLYFRTKPDPVFSAIRHQALESELQEISRISGEKDIDAWEAGYGEVCESFTAYSALVTIEQLLLTSQKEYVYPLSDYHWLLIYECLKNFCAIHANSATKKEDGGLTIGENRIWEIDFQGMVDLYFWDTDFLFLPVHDSSERHCQELSWLDTPSKEALSTDLQTHPRLLQLVPVDEPMWELSEPHEFLGSTLIAILISTDRISLM